VEQEEQAKAEDYKKLQEERKRQKEATRTTKNPVLVIGTDGGVNMQNLEGFLESYERVGYYYASLYDCFQIIIKVMKKVKMERTRIDFIVRGCLRSLM
jgi:hypothetical protein